LYRFHATFLTQKDVPNVFRANPRQIPAISFALKRPTKLKIHIKPTKLYKFHATFLTQKDVPNVFRANPRQIPAICFALKRPTKLKNHLKNITFHAKSMVC
jgi:hypothetical protein